MPQVPIYDQSQVQLNPLPDARVQAGQPGNDALRAGGALESSGQDIGDIAARMQQRQDADMLFRAETAVKENYLQFENQARQRRGQDAWGLTNDATKWWDDRAAEQDKVLENDRQRRMFRMQVAKLRESSIGTLSEYEAGQRRQSLEESAHASITSSINLAAANANDPATLAATKIDILNRVQSLAGLNGWTPEMRTAQQAQALTDFHKQIIQSYVDKDPARAKVYFDANKTEINGADHDVISKVIENGTIRQKAQVVTDSLVASGVSQADALAQVRKQFEGKEEDEIVRRVQERYAEHDALRERDQRNAADQAWGLYAQHGTLSAVPNTLMSRLDGRTQLALKKEEEARLAGKEVQTDWNTFYDLKKQAAGDPQKFASLDLRTYFSSLNPSERRTLIDLQEKTKKPDSAYDVATLEQQLGRTHGVLGWGNKDNDKKGAFDGTVYQAIDAEQQRLKRKLDYKERQAVIDRMVIDGEVLSGHWYMNDPNRKYFQVAGTEDAARFAPKVPDQERKKIEAALTRRGVSATPEAVQRIYALKNGIQ